MMMQHMKDCFIINTRLGLYREAEKQFKSSLKQQDMVDTYLYLCKVYIRLDQPLTAIEIYKQGLEKFPGEVSLLTGIARIHEVHVRPDTKIYILHLLNNKQ